MAMRKNGTNSRGAAFDSSTKQLVWEKGRIVPGVDPNVRRKDACGAWIDWAQYGVTTEGGTGWEIDHIKPLAKGGTDDLPNLQPLQWENNRHKGDDWPKWDCARSAK